MLPLRNVLTLALLSCSFATLSQSKPQEIELLHADRFTVNKHTPKGAHKLVGNVRLKHQNALMFCDSALLFDNNSVQANGRVRIIESDSLTLNGDSLFYDGNTKIARFRSNVTIDNRSSLLKTNFLDYNRETSTGTYYNGGEIDSRKEKIHLTSEKGIYFSKSKLFHYKTNVVMVHPDYTIRTDTMHYSSDLEKTWFFGPTDIEFDNRKIYCEFGWFDQLKDRANFIRNARILTSGQIMMADTIDYDQKEQIGISKCNVVLIDTGQKFEVNGDYAVYHEKDSLSYVTDHMLMKQDMDGDTFFLVADTLFSYMDTASKQRIVKTYHGTRFYKLDMQGQCDSLIYKTKDSLIYMFKDPILWSDANQITADSIILTLKNSTIDKMYMNKNAFIIAHEDSIFYNQIKGFDMVGFFKDSELFKVDVHGNGQTIYYPREEDQSLIGVNETKCSNMTIHIDSNQIKKISFYDRPSAKLTPSDDMPSDGLKLDNFDWRADERPASVSDLIYSTSSPYVKPEPKQKAIKAPSQQQNPTVEKPASVESKPIENTMDLDEVEEPKVEPTVQPNPEVQKKKESKFSKGKAEATSEPD